MQYQFVVVNSWCLRRRMQAHSAASISSCPRQVPRSALQRGSVPGVGVQAACTWPGLPGHDAPALDQTEAMSPTESLGNEQSPSHLPFLPVSPFDSPVAPRDRVLHSSQKTSYTQVIAKVFQTGDTKTGVGQQLFLTITCPLCFCLLQRGASTRAESRVRSGLPGVNVGAALFCDGAVC